jgi:hypothetical protein
MSIQEKFFYLAFSAVEFRSVCPAGDIPIFKKHLTKRQFHAILMDGHAEVAEPADAHV